MNDDHAEYVLAQINEDLRAEVARLASECNDIAADRETRLGKQQLRIAKLEAALTWIGKADQHKHDWVTVGKLLDECSAIARNALEEGK